MSELLNIEMWPATKLIPYAKNPRKITDQAIAAVAGSLKEFGFRQPIVVDAEGVIIAGHTRLLAAQRLGMEEVPVHVAHDMSPEQAQAYRLVDNRAGEFSEWDSDLLKLELGSLADFDLSFAGFEKLLEDMPTIPAVPVVEEMTGGQRDQVPEVIDGDAKSQRGEVYELGPHRLMCGDSTSEEDVHALIGDEQAPLIHADPPYGMGKESDGVENDNLYREKLDTFQMAWWRAWRRYLLNNGSAYIWGNAEDLWRLWYSGGLAASERITFRNEIVWDKESGMGMNSETHRQYATATERCLFFMLGEQGFGNVNKEDYWEGFEPIRSYLEAQAKENGWGAKEINALCGVQMYGHWFSKSQWVMIPEKHYLTLQKAAHGYFAKPYAELRALYDGGTTTGGHLAAKQEFYGTRAYFDNVHDNMRDVWQFARVTGEDRHGHATPKPVDLTARCIKSSAPKGGIVLEPFGGSGSTLIAAAVSGRVCRTMEITPNYCDVIRRRWTKFAKDNGVAPGSGALE